MFEQDTIKHHIGRSIIGYLQTHEFARFSDMRPKGVDTNLFTYHLNRLIKKGFIEKTDSGYTLSKKGLVYVDRVSYERMKLRSQPKIITMLLVQSSDGNVLLQQRKKQPYINTWTLPYGKIHIDDSSVMAAAIRESEEKLRHTPSVVRHVGDCYIVVLERGLGEEAALSSSIQSRTLVHITRYETDEIKEADHIQWVNPLELPNIKLAPAVEQIITVAFLKKDFFFEEFLV